MAKKKENGLGSFGFKATNNDLKKIKFGAAGIYPSDRRFGSSVTRSVIEKMDLDSDWVKWRKGYEYYNQAAWYTLEEFDPKTQEYRRASVPSKLFQGTDAEVSVAFEGYKFATKNADSNSHYVMKRVLNDPAYDIGLVDYVRNDFYYDFDKKNPEYLFHKRLNQILVQIDPGPRGDAVFEMIGDRITDGETEATVKDILNSDQKPALYLGKQYPFAEQLNIPRSTTVEVEIPLSSVSFSDPKIEANWDWDKVVGELIYIPDTFVKRTDDELSVYEWIDDAKYFAVSMQYESDVYEPMLALDLKDSLLPPSLFDLSLLDGLFTAVGTYKITGGWIFSKPLYQKYFGKQYVTADLIKGLIEEVAFNLLPFKVAGYRLTDNDTIVLKSEPYTSEVKLYADVTEGFVAFDSRSFTKTVEDTYTNPDGTSRYYHRDYLPVYKDGKPQPLKGKEILRYEKAPTWMRLETDIDPWNDEVFTSGNPLKPAELVVCSCPNFSKSTLRAPESTQSDGERQQNRQRRYPMPGVESTMDFEGIGINQASGEIASWETREDRMKFRFCKHTVAARFIEYVKTKEPNVYQSIESRLQFEEKLKADIAEVAEEFRNSYERGGISTMEILFAMGQVLNLDSVNMANTIFQSTTQSAAIAQFNQDNVNKLTPRPDPKLDDDFRLKLQIEYNYLFAVRE